jgi:hypothetical protein
MANQSVLAGTYRRVADVHRQIATGTGTGTGTGRGRGQGTQGRDAALRLRPTTGLMTGVRKRDGGFTERYFERLGERPGDHFLARRAARKGNPYWHTFRHSSAAIFFMALIDDL